MKKNKSAIGTAALLLAAGMLTVSLPGCSPAQPSVASPSDFASSEADVAENRADASDAVSVMVEGQQDTEVFLLSYNWYGEEFVSKDSLNKLMMENYAPEGKNAPYVPDGAALSFSFVETEELPTVMKLTQYANTVRANSGIPYEAFDIELSSDENGEYGFTLDYRTYRMYYYILRCEWQNGNAAEYAFAVEKPQ